LTVTTCFGRVYLGGGEGILEEFLALFDAGLFDAGELDLIRLNGCWMTIEFDRDDHTEVYFLPT